MRKNSKTKNNHLWTPKTQDNNLFRMRTPRTNKCITMICPKCKTMMAQYNGTYECEVCGYKQKKKANN
jgi:ribosomal protein S27AE